MLAPRYLRKGVRERFFRRHGPHPAARGRRASRPARRSSAEGVETVAISFVWSVLNPAHERRAAEIVREMMPDVILTVGSELYPQIREYTRTSTAVVNAYLAPVMRKYVARGRRLFPIARAPSSPCAISSPTAGSRSARR